MAYWAEFRAGWRPLLAAFIGMGTGFSTTGVVTSIMAPHFLKDLNWSNAAFAQVGAVSILMCLFIPVAGRLADVIGVRRTAAIGVLTLPLGMIAMSRLTGGMGYYYMIFVGQCAFCVTTTATVYSRVVVAAFQRARGLALAIAASAPGVSGIAAGVFLNPFVEANGWRTGYLVTAALTFVFGLVALALLPPHAREVPVSAAPEIDLVKVPARTRSWADYRAIVRTPAFWVLIVAMILCNLYQTLPITQLNMLVLSKGIDKGAVGGIVSVFSLSMVIGRFLCGVAIDRLPGKLVAVVGMGLPCVGLFLMASSFHSQLTVTVAMAFIGAAVGAEGDLMGVLVARTFGITIYGSVMGLLTGAISLAVASGALLLGITLRAYGNYTVFLLVAGTLIVFGSIALLFLPQSPPVPPADEDLEDEPRLAAGA